MFRFAQWKISDDNARLVLMIRTSSMKIWEVPNAKNDNDSDEQTSNGRSRDDDLKLAPEREIRRFY